MSISVPHRPLNLDLFKSYCDFNTVLNLDLTCKQGHLMVQDFWTDELTRRNLFIYTIEDGDHIEIFRLFENRCLQRIEKSNPEYLKERKLFYSRKILTDFLASPECDPLRSGTNPLTMFKDLTEVQRNFLEKRASKVPLKWIYIQMRVMDHLAMQFPYEPIRSFNDYVSRAFQLSNRAMRPNSTLFYFLESYRFTYTENRTEYEYVTLYKIFQSIIENNPERLQILLSNVLITTKKINNFLEKNNERDTYVSPLNLKYDLSKYGALSPVLPENFKDLTPLGLAIKDDLSNRYNPNLENEKLKIEKLKIEKEKRVEIIRTLIQAGANANEPGLLLHTACSGQLDCAELLVEGKANVNQTSSDGTSFLMQLVKNEKLLPNPIPVYQHFISLGADINRFHILQKEPFLIACTSKTVQASTFKFFINLPNSDLDKIDKHSNTILMKYIRENDFLKAHDMIQALRTRYSSDPDFVFRLLNYQDNQGNSALHHIILNVVAKQRDLNNATVDLTFQKSATNWIAFQKAQDVFKYTIEFSDKLIKILVVDCQVDLKLMNHNGKTAYQLAVDHSIHSLLPYTLNPALRASSSNARSSGPVPFTHGPRKSADHEIKGGNNVRRFSKIKTNPK